MFGKMIPPVNKFSHFGGATLYTNNLNYLKKTIPVIAEMINTKMGWILKIVSAKTVPITIKMDLYPERILVLLMLIAATIINPSTAGLKPLKAACTVGLFWN